MRSSKRSGSPSNLASSYLSRCHKLVDNKSQRMQKSWKPVISFGRSITTSWRASLFIVVLCSVENRTNPLHSILNDVVYAFMTEAEHGHHEDFMRAFFRLRVADIGELLRRVPEVTVNAAKETGRNIAELLPEANAVVLVYFFPSVSLCCLITCVDCTQISLPTSRTKHSSLWHTFPYG